MDTSPAFSLVATVHLVVLSLWGGVVATETVLEIAPFRQRELHPATIRLHDWIDLLVELPLVVAVVATGITLAVCAYLARMSGTRGTDRPTSDIGREVRHWTCIDGRHRDTSPAEP